MRDSLAINFDPNSPELDADPFPTYRWLREHDPVHWWAEARSWIVTRYDDVVTVLKDARFSTEFRHYRNAPDDMADERLTTHQLLTKHGMFWMPDLDHARIRRLMAPQLTPAAVGVLREPLRAMAEEILDESVHGTTFDLARDYATVFPLHSITRLMGIPGENKEDFAFFASFGTAVLDGFFPAISKESLEEKLAHLPKGVAILRELVRQRRTAPAEDFLSALVHAERNGERLSEPEILATAALALSAGSEPVRHLIGFTVLDLLRHPDQLALLREDPSLLAGAIGEAGRFDNFGKLNLPRFALEDVEISGVRIRRGQQVHGVFASAQRDPAVFPDPDTFDVRRDLGQSMLFGDGVHACMGQNLSKLMVSVAVEVFLRRFPHATLAGEPVYERDTFFRKIDSLPLNLGTR